jgi:predicted dehydrogenase
VTHPDPGPRDLRVGVVGAGMVAGCHVRAWSSTPGAEVVAVADPRAAKVEQLAGPVGARAVGDVEQVLAAGVDVVSVCTPPRTHAALAVRAIDAGCHVLVEKPVAASLADARTLLAAAEATDRVVMVGQVSRFEPDHRVARDLVVGGAVGEVAMMLHSMTTSLPGWSEGGWLTDPEQSGGPLLDLAVHSFDYLAWLSGSRATRVHAVAADSPAGPATYTLTTLRYESGALGQVEASWAHPDARGFTAAVEVTGTDGRLSWDYAAINGGVIHAAGQDPMWLDPLGERGFGAEVAAFADAVRSGGPSPVPVRDGFEATRTALAAQESLRTGEPVDLTTWEIG